MGQYKVPQDVQREDKIFGPFTLRQFLTFLVGAMLGYMTFSLVKSLSGSMGPSVLSGLILFGGVAAFGVVEIQGMPLPKYFTTLILYLIKPSKRVWQKDTTIEDVVSIPKKEAAPSPENPEDMKSRLDQLSHILDTKGWAGLEEKEEKEEIETTHKKMVDEGPKKKEDKTSINVPQEKITINTDKGEGLPPKIEETPPRERVQTIPKNSKGSITTETKKKEISHVITQAPKAKANETKKPKIIKSETQASSNKAFTEEEITIKEKKITEEIEKVKKRSQGELKKRFQKEKIEKVKRQKKEIKELKKKVSSLEKMSKNEAEPKKITRKNVKKLFKKPDPKKLEKAYQEAYTVSLEGRMTTPRFVEKSTNIEVDESKLDDVLEETEEIKKLKKEMSEIGSALKKTTKNKEKPKIVKGGNAFYSEA